MFSPAPSEKPALRQLKRAPGPPARPHAIREKTWEILLAGDFNEKQTELLQAVLDVPRGSQGVIYFDSNGGSVYTSLSLMTLIRLRGLRATGIVLGECSSAALLPFAACQKRFVTPFSTHLFHPMKWESEENVRLREAAEWARHFQEIETHFDQLLQKLFPVSADLLATWTEPGRFVSGQELAAAGLAELLCLEELGDTLSHLK
jgi:ATP-dependent Clp protease protease subunit